MQQNLTLFLFGKDVGCKKQGSGHREEVLECPFE